MSRLAVEIKQLQKIHSGLVETSVTKNEIVLKGPLHFEAIVDDMDTIKECFEIELTIPAMYPIQLPNVREIGGKVCSNYHHLFKNRKLCLAIPIEERRIFLEEPTLLGFINRLVIPYFYSYCYWKLHDTYPFGEEGHGLEAIVQYYMRVLDLKNEVTVLDFIMYLYGRKYRDYDHCLCGSGKKIRSCHGVALRYLRDLHNEDTIKQDLLSTLKVCDSAYRTMRSRGLSVVYTDGSPRIKCNGFTDEQMISIMKEHLDMIQYRM